MIRLRGTVKWRRAIVPIGASVAIHAAVLGAVWAGARGWVPRTAEADRIYVTLAPQEAAMPAAVPPPPPPAPAPSVASPGGPELDPGTEPSPDAPRSAPTSEAGAEAPAGPVDHRAPDPVPALGGSGDGPYAATVFAGVGARRARSVVYAVDASGSMVTTLPIVKQELLRAVESLSGAQRFQVVFFRGRGDGGAESEVLPVGPERRGLVRAGREQKAAAAAWIEGIAPEGRSTPLAGLRRALAFQPDVVFLFAHSFERGAGGEASAWGESVEQILRELERLNPRDPRTGRRRVVIKTIQFLREDPTGIMQAIAREHGDGQESYRVVSERDLGR